jgi:hypothetical protein
MKPAALMGRLANGFEADAGKRVHLVPDDTGHYGLGRALCGAEPGRRSGGWDVDWYVSKQVTCPRCLKRAAKEAA